MTASPGELILMMYDQLFELIPEIKYNIVRKSAAAMEADSERAQAIVDELINSLDFSVEMSADLGAIYFYVRNLMLEANIKFNASIWDRIESLMRTLYEGFKEAFGALGHEQNAAADTAGPSIIAGITYGQGSLKEIVVNTRSGLKV
jgi:flagellar protein FliS